MNERPVIELDFRYSVGFYFAEPSRRHVIIWHKCTNKPMCISHSNLEQIQVNRNVCPNCKQPISRWETMHVNRDKTVEKFVYLHFSYVSLVRVEIRDSTISLGVFRSHYNLWNDTSVFAKSIYYIRYAINVKTGYTYQFGEATLSNKNGLDRNRSLMNISYRGANLCLQKDALDYLSFAINKKMRLIHGTSVPCLESYNVPLSLDNLIFYVRNPYICPVLYNWIVHKNRYRTCSPLTYFSPTYQQREVFVKNDCREPIQQLFAQSKVPDVKSLKRIVFANPRGFPLLASISHSFSNVDVIRSLYYAYADCHHYPDEWDSDRWTPYIDFSATIFKTMIKHKGEKNIASKLLKYKKRNMGSHAHITLEEISLYYDELQHCDFDFSKKYSIDELHLYLAASISDQETQNREIEYDGNEMALEMSDGVFAIALAKNTHELIAVGEAMDICVGSYANAVVSRSCTILILRRLENYTPVGCIELYKGNVVQVKGLHNMHMLFQSQERDFVENWIKEKGLTIVTNDLSLCE